MLIVTSSKLPNDIESELQKRGSCIFLPPYSKLPAPTECHSDLILHPTADKLYTFGDYIKSNEAFEKIKEICRTANLPLQTLTSVAGDKYPLDVCLCVKRIGKYIIANPKASPELCAVYESSNFTVLPVKQGYAACSTLAVGDNALISSDVGICRTAQRSGLDVLQIRPGAIDLPGYDTGFIGGASVYCSQRGEIWFCGNVYSHPDGKAIADFIQKHRLDVVCLSSRKLFDCGGIFIL